MGKALQDMEKVHSDMSTDYSAGVVQGYSKKRLVNTELHKKKSTLKTDIQRLRTYLEPKTHLGYWSPHPKVRDGIEGKARESPAVACSPASVISHHLWLNRVFFLK